MIRFHLTETLQKLPENARSLIQTTVFGLGASLSAVAFLFLTNLMFSRTFLEFTGRSKSAFAVASFAVIMGSSVIVSALLFWVAPEAAGSGVPQVKTAYWKEMGYMSPRSSLVKFIAGVLSIGGGNSLGREGPSIYVGSGVASNAAGLFGLGRRERRSASVVGAAASLAAAFNTPLAAITFVIEEVIGDFNSRYLGRVILSSVVGAFVVHALVGRQPAFSLPPVARVTWAYYLIVPFAAALAALAGMAFQRMTIAWREGLRRHRLPLWLQPIIGAFLTWVIGASVFLATGKIGIFGLGYQDLSAALANDFPWKIAGLMVIFKLVATVAGYSFGGSGGIFAPSLFIGGMAGFFTAGLAGLWLPLSSADHVVLAAVGMSACLGAIVRAPMTSLLIVFEMTHQFELIPGLMIGLVISQAISRRTARLNFYDALLVQDGHELHKIRPPLDLQSWQNLSVSAIANPKPVAVRKLEVKALKELIDRYPYVCFPVLLDGRLEGIVTREEIMKSVLAGTLPEIQPAITCFPDQPVREIGDKFIASPVSALIVVDRDGGAVVGIITLHDLIRAQASFQQ
ncbi:MAG TPA: chloride channel protein [Candidatus Desulfaltia sp.]|nr:chloride channel protein [Candidatus Desulfaltia sp.]